ncbi:hypothetical protein HW555_008177 [Spodoptera exigua]|uniref:Uncharacterized protein n=1 Tax=Spodoptera exigua TaxID=7107 RepID=A0A835GEV2_SPOEX|nr:hypothetical protein HW555_008177 [Spodoptera exigua]
MVEDTTFTSADQVVERSQITPKQSEKKSTSTKSDDQALTKETYIATVDVSQPSIEKENQSKPNIRKTISSQEEIDDTLKPDEFSEIDHNETLKGRISNDYSHAKEVVADIEDSPSLLGNIYSSENVVNETLKPE